jgi:hypothetical protein
MFENALVDFLRTYGPTASSDSIWDEHVTNAASKLGVTPLHVPSQRVDDLAEDFRSPDARNVILTGTAGDGKTWHCRQVFMALGGTEDQWVRHDALAEIGVGGRHLTVIKDLSWFFDHPDQKRILEGLLPALLGRTPDRLFLVAANDGQLLRFWREHARREPEAGFVGDRIRGLLKEDSERDPALALTLYNLSRQPHDKLFEEVVEALGSHPGWAGCAQCPLAERDKCPIRRNLRVLTASGEPGMRDRLRNLIRLAAHNDMHLPMRHILLLAVNVLLGVSGRTTSLMRCSTAHALVEEGATESSNPNDNVLGLNVGNLAQRQQYRSFTVFESMGLGRETNNAIDGLLVGAEPADRYAALVSSDPHHGGKTFENVRRAYQRGNLEDFHRFRTAVEGQRRRLFFALPADDDDGAFSPWGLTVFTHGASYLRFVRDLADGRSIERLRHRLVVGLNRTYTGMMCDEGQVVWFAAPAANTQSRLGRILDIAVRVGPSRRERIHFDFDGHGPHGRPRMVVRAESGGEPEVDSHPVTPLLFEYLMRVHNGSLPGSFSRQCFEELRQFRLRVVAGLGRGGLLDHENLGDMSLVRLGPDGTLREDPIEVIT